MTSGLDMSLDDLIKNNKKSTPSRGRAASGPGPARRGPNRSVNRAQPYSKPKPMAAPDSVWQHDMFSDQMAGFPAQAPVSRSSAIETGTKLYISNLDYGVSNEDIKELFSEVGDLKRFAIHYDRSGRSKGTAEVVFSRRTDAVAAVKRYNDVALDGKPMQIEIVGTNVTSSAPVPQATNGLLGNANYIPQRNAPVRGGTISRGGQGGRGRGRGRGGQGGRGRGRGRNDPVSADDLDADLDKYHSESMQVN